MIIKRKVQQNKNVDESKKNNDPIGTILTMLILIGLIVEMIFLVK